MAKSGAGSTCSEDSPCRRIRRALTVALTNAGDNVVVNVAAGTYHETDAIDASSLQSLAIDGAGASCTVVDGGRNGTVMAFSGGLVSLSAVTLEDGLASGQQDGEVSPTQRRSR